MVCHNPSNTDAAFRSTSTVASDRTLSPQGVDFDLLVHRIHFGPNAAADGAKNPYIVVGFGGTHNDLSNTLYPALSPLGVPGDTRNCSICHVNNSFLNLPLGLNQAVDPQGWLSPTQSEAMSCTGCHTSKQEASHFLLNTSAQLGETCDICHGSGAAYAVDKVHAQY